MLCVCVCVCFGCGGSSCTYGSDEDPALCRSYNCSASDRYARQTGGSCIGSLCDICNNMGKNFPVCPDGSDQQPEFCHLKPPKENCIPIDDCNPTMGTCYGKGGGIGPAPSPAPGSVPPPVPAPLLNDSQNGTISQSNASTDSKATFHVATTNQLGNLVVGILIWVVLGSVQ